MSDFRALIFTVDTSPNEGGKSSRPLARVFAVKTEMSLEDIEKPESIKASEFKNIQVGETLQVHGPGYMRVYEITGKPGGFIQLRRVGTENGPDPVIFGSAEIAPGEVFVHVPFKDMKPDAQISVTSKNCDVPFWVSVSDGGFDIDVKTADVTHIHFSWQVRL